MTYQLHHGNCLDILPMMERESVDAIVTDPPYGLGFMGKDWDHGVPGEHFWREAYRVAKPGAHLLAFGGTRTFHRLAVAIEDAGWEIRDTVMWVYGQGFPKSHDVSKAIDREAGAEREVIGEKFAGFAGENAPFGVKKQREQGYRPKWEAESKPIGGNMVDITAPATPAAAEWDGWGTALKPAVENIIIAQKPIDTDRERSIIVENLYQLEAQLWLLSLANLAGDDLKSSQPALNAALGIARWNADEPRNIRDALSDRMDTLQFGLMAHTILSTVSLWLNIWEEALKHGSMFITEMALSRTIDLRTLNSSVSALTLKSIIEAETTQPGSWLNVLPAARVLNAVAMKLSATLELFAVENAIEKGLMPSPDAIDQDVLSLPIIVARKPLQGTVAENVQRYGCGAMNIDACRIGTSSTPRMNTTMHTPSHAGYQRPNKSMFNDKLEFDGQQGRWPANLIHDGSAEVLAGFPVTSSPKPYARISSRASAPFNGGMTIDGDASANYGDTGSAARFFYCAKASKQDRDEGLEEFGEITKGSNFGNDGARPHTSEDYHYEGRQRNPHPTVKPTALMRYLCRLVTPPQGVILDPFMGSGSTGKAAILEGFNFIGIDTEIEYVEIAARRIEHACGKVGIVVEQPMTFETQREKIDTTRQMILL